MSSRSFALNPAVEDYVASLGSSETPLLAELRKKTQSMPNSSMQIGASQGEFMAMLAHLIGAKRYLEIGVFTGYSSLVMAEALPADGRITCCDISEEFTATAREFWRRAGVDGKITLMIGPALDSLAALVSAGEAGIYDIAFIDADKQNIPSYFESCLKLLKPNGLILVDNTLRGGRVLKAGDEDPETAVLCQFNEAVMQDDRVKTVMLPLYDGLTLIRKK